MSGRIIVYSRTGNTARLAERLAARLSAPISRITAPRYRGKRLGYMRAGFDSLREARPPITVSPALAGASWILVGGPVWTSYLCTPVRSFLDGAIDLPPILGVFTTSGGQGKPDNVTAQIAKLGPNGTPVPWLDVRQHKLDAVDRTPQLDNFEALVRAKLSQFPANASTRPGD